MITQIKNRSILLNENPGWNWEDLTTISANINCNASYIRRLLDDRKTEKEITQKIKDLIKNDENRTI